MKTRRRSTMVVAGGTALFAAAVLTGCGKDPDPDYQGVCVNQSTQTRVADSKCSGSAGSSSLDDDSCDDTAGPYSTYGSSSTYGSGSTPGSYLSSHDDCDSSGSSSSGSRGGSSGSHGYYGYRMWPVGKTYPPVGGRVSDYPGSVTTLPEGHSATLGGAGTSSGTVTRQSTKQAVERGGFGKTSRSSSGSVGG
ncbi:hypothetical protein KIH74_18180 [Kineosporia sp. J2-2]|uniref:Lipoprotein n=1 Tax=Kineosporia corallincola TaxID=2835133 RepID=A0ABS5TMQ7_9ACTN|nr:hypothetical protein [Kineosporia corallincola]MBT0770874.1 hypothetical protein [Kineosporia corallincola]